MYRKDYSLSHSCPLLLEACESTLSMLHLHAYYSCVFPPFISKTDHPGLVILVHACMQIHGEKIFLGTKF